VYIQEAHPSDGRQARKNVSDGILYRRHQSFDEREEVAEVCSLNLEITIPVLVEEMDNAVDEAYGAAPERLYVVGKDGKIFYQGGAGPHFFNVEDWEQAIRPCAELS